MTTFHFKTIQILSFCFGFSFSTFAQDSENKWSIGMNFSPDLCYRFVSKEKKMLSEFKNDDTRIGFHCGIGAIYTLNDQFSIQADLGYSSLGFSDKSSVYEANTVEYWNSKRYYYFNNIEIPLGFTYSFGRGKLKGNLTPLTSVKMNLQYARVLNVTPTLGDQFEVMEVLANGFYLNILVGARAGISYQLTNKVILKVLPEYKIGIRKDFHGARLWSLGLNVGCYYNL